MAENQEPKKASPSGSQENSAGSLKRGSVITRVVSFLRREPPIRYIVSIPKGRSFGKAFYTVQSPIEPVTFTNKKDAESFKKLLGKSTSEYQSDIVKREITDAGYEL